MSLSRIKQREALALGLALSLLAGVAGLAYRSTTAAEQTLAWVEHTGLVLKEIEQLSSAYARATSARRAYVVAGDTSQLAELPELDARVSSVVADLHPMLADNPAQDRRLGALSQLLARRLHDLDDQIAARRAQGTGTETALGLSLGSQVRAAREEMEREENRLLAERDARTRRDIGRTELALLLGTAISFVILLLVFRRLWHEITRRHASESFLDSIVENVPNMIFVKDARELRFERINRAGEQLLGVARADLLAKNDFDFLPREQAEFFQRHDRATLSGRVLVDIAEEPIETKTGQRWLHTMKVPVLDEDGAPRHLLGISEDITERRATALALKQAKDAAEAANRELEAFSYSVAHDLRAPLRAIDGYGLALEEDYADALGDEAKSYLKRIRSAATHMGALIDGLLRLSRVSRGDLARERLDLTRLAEQSIARLRELHEERQIEVNVATGLATEGDPRLVAAMLDNLVGNAWKFTSRVPHPRIDVGKVERDDGPAFFVRDNGAGFDPAYAGKLFGAFQRLHGASEFEGHGIGLATVERIVRRHGGRVWAEGAVGQGATFYFTL